MFEEKKLKLMDELLEERKTHALNIAWIEMKIEALNSGADVSNWDKPAVLER